MTKLGTINRLQNNIEENRVNASTHTPCNICLPLHPHPHP